MIAPFIHYLSRGLVWAGLLTLSLGIGCKSYQLGYPAELPFQTIFIQAANNDSFAPQAQALVSESVREAVIRDGRVRLTADPSTADAVLILTLRDYRRDAGTRLQTDTERSQDYDLSLRLQLDLYDQINEKFLFENRLVEARTKAYDGNPFAPAQPPATQGLIQAEYNAMPRLARDLGRKAADELLSAW